MHRSALLRSARVRLVHRIGLLALTTALVGGSLTAATAASAAQTDRIDALAAAHPQRMVDVIVRLDAGANAAAGRADVRRLGGRVTGDLHIIHGLAARLAARDAARLAREDGVASVSLDAPVAPQSINAKDIRTAYPFATSATTVWNGGNYAITGRGVGVAVIDTGIAGSLPDFQVSSSDARSRIVGSAVVNPTATTATDTYGHGTHVAGIIAGNGNNRSPLDPLSGSYVGIAPEANLVSIKVSDDAGNATVLDVIYGLQFAVDHRADYNIRVVNLSLQSTEAQSASTDPLDAAAEAAWFAGLVVVAAAGNRGTDADAVSYAPGNDPYVISVGALDDRGTRSKDDDVAPSWSSRGTTQDGYVKPDIYAAGARIVSTIPAVSAYAALCPECVVSGAYFRAGGTSMSAPVVSGVAALALERNPSMTPNQVKSLIVRTARELPGGLPGVDADAAVRNAVATSLPSANQGLTPNTLLDPVTGTIDYTKSSWSKSSWSMSPPDLTAGWARSSWSCDCSLTATGEVDPTRSSWSRSSWSTSWTK